LEARSNSDEWPVPFLAIQEGYGVLVGSNSHAAQERSVLCLVLPGLAAISPDVRVKDLNWLFLERLVRDLTEIASIRHRPDPIEEHPNVVLIDIHAFGWLRGGACLWCPNFIQGGRGRFPSFARFEVLTDSQKESKPQKVDCFLPLKKPASIPLNRKNHQEKLASLGYSSVAIDMVETQKRGRWTE
jgi:hypothetical protein